MSATQDATYATPGLVLVMEPPWMCILHNCECHTLEEVVGQLVKALECSTEEALTLAITAHEIGKSMVAVGPHDAVLHVSKVLSSIGLQAPIHQS